jgi:hypothetical protein
MVRYYELFEDQTEIEGLLKEYFKITGKPTINPDGTVNIAGDCELKEDKKIKKLPVKFGKVSGGFYCNNNQLTSLVGAPRSVIGNFSCNNNPLTSLEGAPESVGGHFYCDDNQLTSLVGAPQSVGGDFHCNDNQLTSLVGAPQSVGGYFGCYNNQLTSLEGAPQLVGGDFNCFNNQLTSLEGAPQSVGGYFNCGHNQLTSLVGAPQSGGGYFDCDWSPTLPLLRTVVYKRVAIHKGETEFKEINDILNSSITDNPGSYRKAALDAKRKLIDAGFKGNAQW